VQYLALMKNKTNRRFYENKVQLMAGN